MKLALGVLPALVLCSLSPALKADRFYFGTAKAEQQMVAGEPDYLEGVLLEETDGLYVIRIEGGEIRVPKASVRKIEKDDLTAEALEKRESDARSYLAEANALRSNMLVADAAARMARIRQAQAAEASARREAPTEAPAQVVPAGSVYDPVLHVSYPAGTTPYMVQKEFGGIIRRQMQRETREQLKRM